MSSVISVSYFRKSWTNSIGENADDVNYDVLLLLICLGYFLSLFTQKKKTCINNSLIICVQTVLCLIFPPQNVSFSFIASKVLMTNAGVHKVAVSPSTTSFAKQVQVLQQPKQQK